MNKKATPAHKADLWVEAMIQNGGNATQAAVTAGYKKGMAAQKAGHRLSTNVQIAAKLAARRAQEVGEAMGITGLTVKRTLQEVARIAYFDPRKLYNKDGQFRNVADLDDDTAAVIAGIEIDELTAGETTIGLTKKVKLWDKNAALEKAMKHLGQYEADNEQAGKALAKAIYVPGKG